MFRRACIGSRSLLARLVVILLLCQGSFFFMLCTSHAHFVMWAWHLAVLSGVYPSPSRSELHNSGPLEYWKIGMDSVVDASLTHIWFIWSKKNRKNFTAFINSIFLKTKTIQEFLFFRHKKWTRFGWGICQRQSILAIHGLLKRKVLLQLLPKSVGREQLPSLHPPPVPTALYMAG